MRPLRLDQHFIGLLCQAHARQKIRKRLPKRKRGYARFQASDGSIHDVPATSLDQALTIDQRWCFQTGNPPQFTLLDNDALRRFDQELQQTYDMVIDAYTLSLRS